MRKKVTLCTRDPLTAHSVMGTVCLVAVDAAVKVSVAAPLTRLDWLIEAVTPEGRPVMRRFTVP